MKHLLILAGMCVAASVIAPVVVMAEEHHGEKRYYDQGGRDYHYWNDGEDRNYRAYVVEQHRHVCSVCARERPANGRNTSGIAMNTASRLRSARLRQAAGSLSAWLNYSHAATRSLRAMGRTHQT